MVKDFILKTKLKLEGFMEFYLTEMFNRNITKQGNFTSGVVSPTKEKNRKSKTKG